MTSAPWAGFRVSTSWVLPTVNVTVACLAAVPALASSARPTAPMDAASTNIKLRFTAILLCPHRVPDYVHIPRVVMIAGLVRSDQVPVEEALDATVEVDLRAGSQEAVCLGRIGHVLECLPEAPELGDELLRLLRVDALVPLAVGDEDRDADVLEPMHRRARDVGVECLER